MRILLVVASLFAAGFLLYWALRPKEPAPGELDLLGSPHAALESAEAFDFEADRDASGAQEPYPGLGTMQDDRPAESERTASASTEPPEIGSELSLHPDIASLPRPSQISITPFPDYDALFRDRYATMSAEKRALVRAAMNSALAEYELALPDKGRTLTDAQVDLLRKEIDWLERNP